MEKKTDATAEYEAPRIEDHGDLTELTASVGKYGNFDANYSSGSPIPPNYGTSTQP
jgi:hypothetical protein